MNAKIDSRDRALAGFIPPWLECPYRLISWYDMNKFSAELFVNIGSSLQWLGTLADTGKWNEQTLSLIHI